MEHHIVDVMLCQVRTEVFLLAGIGLYCLYLSLKRLCLSLKRYATLKTLSSVARWLWSLSGKAKGLVSLTLIGAGALSFFFGGMSMAFVDSLAKHRSPSVSPVTSHSVTSTSSSMTLSSATAIPVATTCPRTDWSFTYESDTIDAISEAFGQIDVTRLAIAASAYTDFSRELVGRRSALNTSYSSVRNVHAPTWLRLQRGNLAGESYTNSAALYELVEGSLRDLRWSFSKCEKLRESIRGRGGALAQLAEAVHVMINAVLDEDGWRRNKEGRPKRLSVMQEYMASLEDLGDLRNVGAWLREGKRRVDLLEGAWSADPCYSLHVNRMDADWNMTAGPGSKLTKDSLDRFEDAISGWAVLASREK